ncbi:MAG: NAD-dependent epimerase/dehydratase family protein [Anaerolineales bacterium]
MNIFITGGTGFIGGYLVNLLSKTEHQLVCLARISSDISTLQDLGVKVVIGDILDKASLIKGMQGSDWVVNLASNFVFWVPNKTVYRDVNVQGTQNIMESALEVGISKIVHVSTQAVYGNAPWPITEDSDLGAYCPSEYAQTKREGDQIAWRMFHEKGLPLVMIYPGSVIGANDPKAPGRYLKNIALRRMPGQVVINSPFPWVYVEDVCKAILKALEKENNIGEKYFVSGCILTFGEMNQLIAEIAEVQLPWLILPDSVATASARLLTWIADLIKKPPLLDLSVDQVALMKQGYITDGSKATRELGLSYTPIRVALQQALALIMANKQLQISNDQEKAKV